VIAGISPLIWRRMEVAASTTMQTVFARSGEHLHRFVIGGTEYGISYAGGPGFRDDARQIRLADLRPREGERRYRWNWRRPEVWRTALTSRPTLRSSMPVMASPRLTGAWPARLAARRGIRRSSPELGSLPRMVAVPRRSQTAA
jgi:Plasmid pRiA4b ORF-3-like protein